MNHTVKLDRTLGLWSVVLFGLAYMTPMIVFGTFGALATTRVRRQWPISSRPARYC